MIKTEEPKADKKPNLWADRITIPASEMPEFRSWWANEHGVEKNILIKTWGGLGDQICAEPTLRYALNYFKDCNVSLHSERPELFTHLNFKRVFDANQENPLWEKYFVFETIVDPDKLVWQFFSHCLVNCVDFPSLCAFRSQLPNKDKEIILRPPEPKQWAKEWVDKKNVYIHAGRHWPSKTFPKWWWDDVLARLVEKQFIPVLIGGDSDDNRGTVDVNPYGCIDLRNKISVTDSVWLLQRAGIVLTNDSAPLHMAASGDAWIGFIATCKHPDYIMHWRKGQFGYKEENLGLGGMWELMDYLPNKKEKLLVDKVDQKVLESWLPEPGDVVRWVESKWEGS